MSLASLPAPSGTPPGGRLPSRLRVRQVVNAVSGATLLGLAVAKLGGARLVAGPDGLVLATGYGWKVPPNPAFTVGNVVIVRHEAVLLRRPRLLTHEARHATQWAAMLGVFFLPTYLAASGWSLLRSGDPSSANWLEKLANFEDGGYSPRPVRPLLRRSPRDG